ncbi:fatty-acyl-CoA synthase [Yoonia rosea]|uniref:Fatty-acyl-CoA synthase n=1 Tax=Yoonia rosea TaxID=287098 RepID=A0A1R3WDM7_9RHOB|nr:AMP-binding protein [Yoonia rosea]SIT76291.1 fatty-acyl-CoA synthase [Yoonia rosea]
MLRTHLDHWPAGLPRTLPPATHTLDDNLRAAAAAVPDKPALVFYGATKTYAALDAEVTQIAGYLQKVCNVAKGDRVGIYMQNAPQFVAAFYGVIRAGGVAVPINAMHKQDEVTYICKDAGIRTVFAAQDTVGTAAPLIGTGVLDHVMTAYYGSELPASPLVPVPDFPSTKATDPMTGVVDWTEMMAMECPFAPVALAVDDVAIMPYTSGSTGRGKGCIHTHATALHAVNVMASWFHYTGDEVHLGATPMFHIVGMQGIMNAAIATQATIVIMSRWDRNAAAGLIAAYGVSVWCTVPTAIIDLLNAEGLKAEDLASLDLIYGGGSAMPDAVAGRLRDLTGLQFVEVYGMTEAMGPITHNSAENPKTGSVGMPVMDTDLALLDPDTLAPVPAGDVGEIVVSGPQMLRGYWNNPDADQETFITLEGKRFLRTGDLAQADEQGRITIVDRLKRMVNASGYKVWPAEVESRLYQHPAIAEVCVVGAPDAYRGQTVKAVAVLKTGTTLTAEDLTAWAQDHMAAYKVPRLLEVVDSLPKSPAGKVLWRTLQDNEDAKVNT